MTTYRKSHASVLRSAPGEYEPCVLEVEDPRPGEIMVRMVAVGLCHSDDHITTGDFPVEMLPMCGGHEGAGVVEKVGEGTTQFDIGDHVVLTFLPACGRCLWCSRGMQQLCDAGAYALTGSRFDDPTSYRMRLDGQPCGQQLGLSAFSEYTTVSVQSAYKVPKDLPLNRLCLLGCAMGTGWGTAVNAAGVKPGHTVIVMGLGGVGAAAVQGAAHAGAANILVVDPVAYKREVAPVFGATEVFATMDEAAERARSYTNGQGADSTMITVGRMEPDNLSEAVESIRKGGTVAMTSMGAFQPEKVSLDLSMVTLMQKTIKGVIYGNWSPFEAVPSMLSLYAGGQLKTDEMVTRTYALDDIAQGYRDMKQGKNIRSIVEFG